MFDRECLWVVTTDGKVSGLVCVRSDDHAVKTSSEAVFVPVVSHVFEIT